MNWVNIRTEFMRSALVMAANEGALGTWLRVLTYCCEQENSGRIKGAESWTDRHWLCSCGVTKKDVTDASPLIVSDGVDIILEAYPLDRQKEVQKDRANGRKGGRCKTQAKTQASRENGTQGGRPKHPKPNPSHEPNGIGMEEEWNNNRKGMEEEGNEPWTSHRFEEEWNRLPSPIPKIQAMSPPRMDKFKTRMKDPFWATNIARCIEIIRSTPFLHGQNNKQWVISPDWLLENANNLVKVVEGNYAKNGSSHTPKEHEQERQAELHKTTSRFGI